MCVPKIASGAHCTSCDPVVQNRAFTAGGKAASDLHLSSNLIVLAVHQSAGPSSPPRLRRRKKWTSLFPAAARAAAAASAVASPAAPAAMYC